MEKLYFEFYDHCTRAIDLKYSTSSTLRGGEAASQATDSDPLGLSKLALDVVVKLYDLAKDVIKERKQQITDELEKFKVPSWQDVK